MPSPYDYRAFFREEEDNTQREYWGESAAGCIFVAKDTGRILIAHRSDRVDYEPETWGTWGGKIDMDESPKQAVEREVEEETGFTGQYKIHPLYTYRDGTFAYHNYLVVVPFEFTPQLNWENDSSSWVDFGDWPAPLHFGLIELIKHAGGKIQKVIDLLKKKKDNMLEAMDIPPQPATPIVKSAHVFSSRFIDYIKAVENSNKTGFKDNKWYPHHSPEGGLPTIAFGHKVDKNELKGFSNGITNSEAVRLLSNDLALAKKKVYSDIKSMFGVQIPLEDYQEEMLTDYAFNLGTLKKFPKFVRAVLNKDWNTAKKEYIRTYKDEHGKTHVSGRNKIFFDTYLKNLHSDPPKKSQRLNESVGGIDIIRQGLVDDGVFGYEMRSPKSFVRYGFEPSRKLFHLYMVGTPNTDDRNQGHSKSVLDSFFQFIKQSNGALDVGSYTGEGMDYVKHVVERLAKQYGVRLV